MVFDRKKKAGKSHEGNVDLRLSQDRRSLYIHTGIRLLARHWHDGQVVNRSDAAEIQQTLDLWVRRARQAVNILMEKEELSLDGVVSILRRADHPKLTFLDFCQDRIAIRTYNLSKDSRKRYERFLAYLISFGRIEHFSDVTEKNILAMDEQLAATGMKPYSKWQNYHRILNSFILDAIDAGHLSKNPYRWLNIEKDKSNGGIGKYLTKEEFMMIRNSNLPTDSLQRVRDVFVFQTYTCLSYTDLASFDASKITYVNGYPCYTSKRGKTKQEFTFLVLPAAMDILRKYDYKLPVISNVKYNQYLKSVAQMSGIRKPISSHWARHTGATMLLNEGGLDMEVVAKVLGHSSTKITRQVYAKLLDETVVKAMSKIE
jgi:site-specific recombinase XerD